MSPQSCARTPTHARTNPEQVNTFVSKTKEDKVCWPSMAVSICDPGAGRGMKEDQDFEAVGGLHYLGKSLFQKTKKKKT